MLTTDNLLRLVVFGVGLGAVGIGWLLARRAGRPNRLADWVLAAAAGASIAVVGALVVNHLTFPLFLDLMEGTILQHVRRAATFQAIYPEPSPAYVPLAYNPLYYVLAVPFTWVFGSNLFTLRLVSVLGMLGSGGLLYVIVQQRTRSVWWGLMAAGLFAAAYRVMDTYLDNAHSDAWFLFAALLGSYVIDQSRSRRGDLLGVVGLVASFWFKQHGAFFAVGGVLFLTWRDGVKRAWPYWLAAFLLGPVAYLGLGPMLFGARFLYFTWEVPRAWSEVNLGIFRRYAVFILKSYPVLALSGAGLTLWTALRQRRRLDIWHVQFVFALLTGLMGSLDSGSANNVYIPIGTWFILVGTLGLHTFATRFDWARRYQLAQVALVVTLAMLAFDPTVLFVSSHASASYADFLSELRGLNGTVYAPWLGQLEGGYAFYPAVHWVALEDMIRGPGRDERNHPLSRLLLAPALHPPGPAYIVANYPLEYFPSLVFLKDNYVLEADWGNRFEPLRVLPKRFDHAWPRYLYRYVPSP